MTWILILPLILQGSLILLDEIHFHRRRGLPRWEIWGHPLDTLTVALPVSLAVFWPLADRELLIFIFLSIFSCVFVTKDELIHAKVCSPGEHWLHSFLFLLHPVVFAAVYWLWAHGGMGIVLSAHLILLISFMFYQILFWSRQWQFLKIKPRT